MSFLENTDRLTILIDTILKLKKKNKTCAQRHRKLHTDERCVSVLFFDFYFFTVDLFDYVGIIIHGMIIKTYVNTFLLMCHNCLILIFLSHVNFFCSQYPLKKIIIEPNDTSNSHFGTQYKSTLQKL